MFTFTLSILADAGLKLKISFGFIGIETREDFSFIEYGALNKCLGEIKIVSSSTSLNGLKIPFSFNFGTLDSFSN